MAIGAGQDGAVHSHVRRALEAGATRDELRLVGLLAFRTARGQRKKAASRRPR